MTTTDKLVKEAINHARENPNLLKTYIFFEATSESIQNYSKCRPIQEPCYQNYKKMCEKYGDDAMDYQEFEFWYMRFSSGEFDMDYDRSLAPRNRSFTDLPIDVFEMIAEHLHMYDRLMLRRVSKSLREFMEKQVFDCTDIDVSFGDNFILVTYGNEEILYAKNDKAVETYEKEYNVRGAPILYKDESEVYDDLACVLKNPKVQIDFLDFWNMLPCYKEENAVVPNCYDKVKLIVKPLKHQINVQEIYLSLDHPDDVLAILPYLKPGYLEMIEVNTEIGLLDRKIDEILPKVQQIVMLDQWKQAKELVIQDTLHLLPDEVFAQFKKYTIHTGTLNRSQLDRIKTMFATSAVFEYCFIFSRETSIDSIGVPEPAAEGHRFVRHLMIPNTDKMLVFIELSTGSFAIEKKTRDVQ